MPTPTPLPSQVLLQVPFTTQAPLNNWAQHQESCEAATLTMLVSYWQHSSAVVIDPHAADASINQIDKWKSQPDLNVTMMGELAEQHFGYAYRIVPNEPKVIAEQLSAGRPLIAEVRTHALGNPRYPGYSTHYEQNGYSVPHFILIIGYDSTGVWLNDPGISWGRGYHISYAQLAHAIDSLDQHHPALNQGQVLLLLGGPHEEGVEDKARVVLPVAERAQPADQEQQLAQRGLLLHRGEPLGRLQHGHARGVAGVVADQRRPVGPDDLGLRDDVQRTARVQHQVDVRERLQPGAEPRLGPPDALGHGPDPSAGAAEDGDDPVRLAQLLRPQHDPVIPVELHQLILPYSRDIPPQDASGRAVPPALTA